MKKSEIGPKFATWRSKIGLSQGAAIERLSCNRSYLSSIENSKRLPGTHLAERMKLLMAGGRVDESPGTYLISGPKRVPVISSAQASEATGIEEMLQGGQRTIPTHCEDPKAFAICLSGDSMEPQFKAGDIAVLMPSQELRNGCLIIARLSDSAVVFRIYNRQRGQSIIRLTSYNSVYEPMVLKTSEIKWIYPVHSVIKDVWK